ncbi:MAG: hypothetical protein DRN33_04120 [Thermoplasmata archaeon]|nr:MAG: hypothetical protein DRN33_04120 [Thermoplasmata archaeon]
MTRGLCSYSNTDRTGRLNSFNRWFYKPKKLRSLDEIRADLLAVEKEAKGLLEENFGRNA